MSLPSRKMNRRAPGMVPLWICQPASCDLPAAITLTGRPPDTFRFAGSGVDFREINCMTTARLSRQPLSSALGVTLIIAVAIGGLFYVKWLPYVHKAILASTNHSIGHSILMGDAAEPPPASWKAALNYSLAYGKAIWQVMVLGLLLGAAVQEFAPRAWLARLLGGSDFRSVTIGVLNTSC
jgi:hypothetical protein